MEELMSLGGFIEKTISEHIFDSYPGEVIDALTDKIEPGEGIFDVADAVMTEYMKQVEYIENAKRRRRIAGRANSSDDDVDDMLYLQWYLSLMAELYIENMKNDRHFWSDWSVSAVFKKQMTSLSLVEELVLGLYAGAVDGRAHDVGEIADMEMMDCSEDYIVQILRRVTGRLNLAVLNQTLERYNCKTLNKFEENEQKGGL